MVTRLLNVCGLYLGPDADVVVVKADNPEGFWEHMGFVFLNDDLLKHLGGSWHQVPQLREGWASQAAMAPFRERAQVLLRHFAGREPWGWKDPRNCLTIEFWQKLLPDLRFFICLRNPLDVALSLCRRDGFTLEYGLDLWTASHERLLAAVGPGQRIVSHYSAYFHDPRAELRRVLGALGMIATEDQIDRAIATIAPNLRHSHLPTTALKHAYQQAEHLGARVSETLLKTYESLCAEAGPVFQATEANAATTTDAREEVYRIRLKVDVARYEGQVAEKEFQLAEEGRRLVEEGRRFAEQGRLLAETQARLRKLEERLQHRPYRIAERLVRFYMPIVRRLGL